MVVRTDGLCTSDHAGDQGRRRAGRLDLRTLDLQDRAGVDAGEGQRRSRRRDHGHVAGAADEQLARHDGERRDVGRRDGETVRRRGFVVNFLECRLLEEFPDQADLLAAIVQNQMPIPDYPATGPAEHRQTPD